jgi:hypothetical protein
MFKMHADFDEPLEDFKDYMNSWAIWLTPMP